MATAGLRERKNERTRQAITRAALELASEVGFERATIAQIAERADVSPRTVHAWFSSKEDIVVGAPIDAALERLASELADGEGDVLDRVERWITAEGQLRDEPEDVGRLRHQVLVADSHLRALQRGRQEGVERLIADAVAREVGLDAAALGPRSLAGAVVASFLAMQELHASGQGSEADGFASVLPMLRAALAALHAGS